MFCRVLTLGAVEVGIAVHSRLYMLHAFDIVGLSIAAQPGEVTRIFLLGSETILLESPYSLTVTRVHPLFVQIIMTHLWKGIRALVHGGLLSVIWPHTI